MGSDGHRAGSELFVCFPSRTTMSLMPKPILSPGRNGDAAKRLRNNANRGQSSPMFSIHATGRERGQGHGHGHGRGRSSKKNSEYEMELEMEEPTSPKVTCAGQVRVKPTKPCKSWQSVMAEIEKLHHHKHRKSRASISSPGRGRAQAQQHPRWSQALGLKREILQFVAALRNLRVDLGCFGAPSVSTDDDDEDDDGDSEEECREPTSSGTVFAKWFMILQDNDDQKLEKLQSSSSPLPREEREEDVSDQKVAQPPAEEDGAGDSNGEPAVPPPNALLLMRCRSAPSRSPLAKVEDSKNKSDSTGKEKEKEKGKGKSKGKTELTKKPQTSSAVVLRRCEPDFSALLSMDVSKETWVSRRDFINQSFMRSVSLKG